MKKPSLPIKRNRFKIFYSISPSELAKHNVVLDFDVLEDEYLLMNDYGYEFIVRATKNGCIALPVE